MQAYITRRRIAVIAALAVAAVSLIICRLVSQDDSPKPAQQSNGPVFKVVGDCIRGEGALFGAGSGFTPDGKYVTQVWRPNGRPYTDLHNPGTASGTGTTPRWHWSCSDTGISGMPDPSGIYKVKLTDLQTGKDTGIVTFQVGKGRGDLK